MNPYGIYWEVRWWLARTFVCRRRGHLTSHLLHPQFDGAAWCMRCGTVLDPGRAQTWDETVRSIMEDNDEPDV